MNFIHFTVLPHFEFCFNASSLMFLLWTSVIWTVCPVRLFGVRFPSTGLQRYCICLQISSVSESEKLLFFFLLFFLSFFLIKKNVHLLLWKQCLQGKASQNLHAKHHVSLNHINSIGWFNQRRASEGSFTTGTLQRQSMTFRQVWNGSTVWLYCGMKAQTTRVL